MLNEQSIYKDSFIISYENFNIYKKILGVMRIFGKNFLKRAIFV